MSTHDMHFQLTSIESADPNEVLDRILYAWALKHGITIEPLGELMSVCCDDDMASELERTS